MGCGSGRPRRRSTRIEAADTALKERVYQKAKAVGLWPKWRPSDGWLLVNGGDTVVCEGPMSALNEYLDHTSSAIRGYEFRRRTRPRAPFASPLRHFLSDGSRDPHFLFHCLAQDRKALS